MEEEFVIKPSFAAIQNMLPWLKKDCGSVSESLSSQWEGYFAGCHVSRWASK